MNFFVFIFLGAVISIPLIAFTRMYPLVGRLKSKSYEATDFMEAFSDFFNLLSNTPKENSSKRELNKILYAYIVGIAVMIYSLVVISNG